MQNDDVEQFRQKLLRGIKSFSADIFPEKKDAYERIMRDGQNPHTLFTTCADSCFEPAAINQSEPGDVFVSRNIGNLVPA